MRRPMLAAALVALTIAGCGGGDETTSPSVSAKERTHPQGTRDEGRAYARRAEAICGEMVTEAQRLGTALRERKEFPSDPLVVTTQLIAPAIPLVEASAKRLRGVEGPSGDGDFEAYVKVYDPLLALLRQRVEAGEAGERERAKSLEAQIVELIALQQRLADAAGLDDCDVDFIRAFATPDS